MKTFHLFYFPFVTVFILLTGCKDDPVSNNQLPQILYGQVVDSQGIAIENVGVHYIFHIPGSELEKIETYIPSLSKAGKICPSTNISFSVPARSKVTLRLFRWYTRDTIGTLINDTLAGGTHSIGFDASKITNGFYFYQLKIDTIFVEKILTYLNLDMSTLILADPLVRSNTSGSFELPYALLGFGVPMFRTNAAGTTIDSVQISSTFEIVLCKPGYSTITQTVTIDPAVGLKQTFVFNKN